MKSEFTFLSCLNRMISLSFCLILCISLHFSKIWTFIMWSKINNNLFIITRKSLLILLYTSFNNNIHIIISIAFTVNLFTSLMFLKGTIIKYFPSFLYMIYLLPLFKMIKNLLKLSILYNLSILLFPGGLLNYSLMQLIFYNDCISIVFKISLIDGI